MGRTSQVGQRGSHQTRSFMSRLEREVEQLLTIWKGSVEKSVIEDVFAEKVKYGAYSPVTHATKVQAGADRVLRGISLDNIEQIYFLSTIPVHPNILQYYETYKSGNSRRFVIEMEL